MMWSVVGYVRVKLSGDDIRSFFDMCLEKNIPLKNVLCLKGVYRADVLSTNLKKLLPIAKKCNVIISVEGRFGFAMKLFIYRNRLTFFIMFLILCLTFYANSFFVGDIIINGNNYLTDKQISSFLKECGIYKGKFIPTISPDHVRDEMRKKCTALSWIWVDVKGTTAKVNVREKVPKPEFFDDKYVCNIVAERDGVITEAISEKGILYAKEGNFVQKGELLIGGVYDSNEFAPVRFVHASGRVYAQTTYTLCGTFSSSYTSYTNTGKIKSYYGIMIGDKTFEFGFGKNKASFKKLYSKEKFFEFLGKFSIPLGFTNNKYCEIIKTECKLDKEATVTKAVGELTERLSSQLPPDAHIINITKDITDNSDGKVSVAVTALCIEDIATEKPIILSE